jgi:DNA polymerase-3 subunit delta
MATRKATAADKIPHLHFVTGSDEAEVRVTAKDQAAKLAPADAGEFGIETIELPADTVDCSLEMIDRTIGAIRTLPFFGGKLVWMKGVSFLKDTVQGRSETVQEALEKFLGVLREGLPEGVTLLISAPEPDKRRGFYKTLTELAQTTVKDRLELGGFGGCSEDDLIDWVTERCHDHGVRIDPRAAEVLAGRIGANSGQLQSEIQKLSSASGEGQLITEQLVRDLVPLTRAGGIFDLSDAINKRNLPLCLDTFAQLRRQGENSIGILLAAIVPTVRNLLIAKDLMERHRLKPPAQPQFFSSDLKRLRSEETAHLPRKKDGTLNTYGIGLAAVNAARFDRDHLVSAFLACRDTNQKLLSGHGSEETLLTQLIVRIVAKKANYPMNGQTSVVAR